MPTLESFVHERGWDYGEGFIVGNRKDPSNFLKDKPFLPTKALTVDGIDESQIGTVKESRFEAERREELYTPPIVLIKELQSLPAAFWDKGFLAYGHEIVGMPFAKVRQVCAEGVL